MPLHSDNGGPTRIQLNHTWADLLDEVQKEEGGLSKIAGADPRTGRSPPQGKPRVTPCCPPAASHREGLPHITVPPLLIQVTSSLLPPSLATARAGQSPLQTKGSRLGPRAGGWSMYQPPLTWTGVAPPHGVLCSKHRDPTLPSSTPDQSHPLKTQTPLGDT